MHKAKLNPTEFLQQRNKERYHYYSKQKNMIGKYNYANVLDSVFSIYRIRDNRLLMSFSLESFLPV